MKTVGGVFDIGPSNFNTTQLNEFRKKLLFRIFDLFGIFMAIFGYFAGQNSLFWPFFTKKAKIQKSTSRDLF